jgi:hypothetical protein
LPTLSNILNEPRRKESLRVGHSINSRGREVAQRLRNNRDGFYNQFAKVPMVQDDGELQRAMVRMDGRGRREFQRSPESYLRRASEA